MSEKWERLNWAFAELGVFNTKLQSWYTKKRWAKFSLAFGKITISPDAITIGETSLTYKDITKITPQNVYFLIELFNGNFVVLSPFSGFLPTISKAVKKSNPIIVDYFNASKFQFKEERSVSKPMRAVERPATPTPAPVADSWESNSLTCNNCGYLLNEDSRQCPRCKYDNP